AAWTSNADPKKAAASKPQPATLPPTPSLAAAPALGLAEAIETSLTRNPDLIALRESENVGRAVVRVAATYPFNPTVQTRILPYNKFQNGTDAATYNYVLVWQQFELAHQRRYREANASAALDATRWTIQQAELVNVALTTQLYLAALYQHGLHDLAEMT